MLKQILILMRPQQWVKNLLLFAGLIFSKNLLDFLMLEKAFLSFFLFCLLCSSLYIFNDIIDCEQDKKHPDKANRPLASGKIKKSTAWLLFFIFAPISLVLAFILSPSFFLVALAYFLTNLFYTVYLKHIVIIDVMVISLGFVLRAVAGALVINVEISSWLIVCTTLLALFLGFGKRRYELVALETNAQKHRKILSEYSPYFLDQLMAVVTASTLVAYAFYTLSPEVEQKFGTKNMDLTIPFVLYGIFRYLYLIHRKESGGSPTITLLTDKPILINIILWLLSVFLIVYYF
jgi:4-hydroxybenzoate polyprenyltransferase